MATPSIKEIKLVSLNLKPIQHMHAIYSFFDVIRIAFFVKHSKLHLSLQVLEAL